MASTSAPPSGDRTFFRVLVAGSLLGLGVILAFVVAAVVGESVVERVVSDD